MEIFAFDGPLAKTVRAVWRYFLLNMCFIICCLPVVTIGASATALYSVMLPSSDETGCFKKFFSSFHSNFSQATRIWLLFLCPLILLGVSLYLSIAYIFPGNGIIKVLTLICFALYMSVISFVFPLQARYDNPPKTTIRNAFVLGIFTLLPGLLMGAITLLPLIAFLLDLNTFIYILILWQFAGFALTAKINAKICMSVFSKLDPVPESPDKASDFVPQ